jgi:two-component system sensor histidine kinase HydH
MPRMKIPVRTGSLIAALLCWILFSALTVFIIQGMRDRARLIRDNDNEQILNMLFAGLRGDEGFDAALESNPILKERIAGFAIYGNNLAPDYRWGLVPPRFNENLLKDREKNRTGRYTIPDKQGHRVKFVLHTERMAPPPPSPPMPRSRQREEGRPRRSMTRQNVWFMDILMGGKYLYIDIAHPAYWRTETITRILFPLCELVLLGLVFYIRTLYLRNREYRERIESQKNLVVLGTAASTLAHEIKNPLLSIRLQTGILKKLFAGEGADEITIIDEEVDRLSALTYRVNDYLRDGEGHKTVLNIYDLIAETSIRLCGRNILEESALRHALILMDADRARSVIENLIRNALESGGPGEAVGASVTRSGGSLIITVFDRGKGIPPSDLGRVFDPFYTSKSTGTGIGLSIVKRFVEAVHGSITLEQREAGGTAAKLILPEYITRS